MESKPVTAAELAEAIYPFPAWWSELTSETKATYERQAKLLMEKYAIKRKAEKRGK